MKYKIVESNVLISVGEGVGETQITDEEYDRIIETVKNKPSAPSGYMYRLLDDLTWEMVELPEPDEPELTSDEAIGIIFGGAE